MGARQAYAVPRVLHAKGLLEALHTDLCATWFPLRVAQALVPQSLRPRALTRLLGRVPGIPNCHIRCFPWFAAENVWRRSRIRSEGELLRFYAESNRAFCRRVVRRGFGRAGMVYGYNGASLEILKSARDQGLVAVLEQTSSPVVREQMFLSAESQRWPDWESCIPSEQDWGPLCHREREEWAVADRIVCGSQWVTEGMAAVGGPVAKCRVVPYSVPPHYFSMQRAHHDRDAKNRALRVLFVGNVRLLKGVQYLMQAAQMLRGEGIEFRVVGPSSLTPSGEVELRRHLELFGPVPRTQVAEQFTWADVFVLPTLSEGSALVCYEALAAGLPVITTPNAGSVVRNESEGYIVPIRDAQAIAQRIDCLAHDRELLAEMSSRATARAREFTPESYATRLLSALFDACLP